eukprot:118798_1
MSDAMRMGSAIRDTFSTSTHNEDGLKDQILAVAYVTDLTSACDGIISITKSHQVDGLNDIPRGCAVGIEHTMICTRMLCCGVTDFCQKPNNSHFIFVYQSPITYLCENLKRIFLQSIIDCVCPYL